MAAELISDPLSTMLTLDRKPDGYVILRRGRSYILMSPLEIERFDRVVNDRPRIQRFEITTKTPLTAPETNDLTTAG
jgi:hypothetical protein